MQQMASRHSQGLSIASSSSNLSFLNPILLIVMLAKQSTIVFFNKFSVLFLPW
jgi:hypothetical protein